MLLHSSDPGLPQLPLYGGKAYCLESSPTQWAKALVAAVSRGCLSAGQTETAPEWKKKNYFSSEKSVISIRNRMEI